MLIISVMTQCCQPATN